jgi:hypothetical protein
VEGAAAAGDDDAVDASLAASGLAAAGLEEAAIC